MPNVRTKLSGPILDPIASWVSPHRRRTELAVVLLACVTVIGMPIALPEFFPFSRFWLFADAPQHTCNYEILSPDGEVLPVADFALQRNYSGAYPYQFHGVKLAPTVNEFGRIETAEFLVEHLSAILSKSSKFAYVDVLQETIGPDGKGTIRSLRTLHWRVSNPRNLQP